MNISERSPLLQHVKMNCGETLVTIYNMYI